MSEEQTVETPVEVTDTVEQNVDILTSEGKFNEAWRDALPDDLGKHSIWSKYDNPTDLVKGAINAQSQIGKKAEDFWLSEDANDIARRREIMNIPNEVSGYEFKTENIPEDTELDTTKVDSFKELAHKVGLTQEQAQAVVDWEVQGSAESLQELDTQAEVAVKQAEEDLRKEWAGDKYEYNMGKVANVMDYLGLGEFKDDPDIGNNVPFIKAVFENVVPLISDDEIIQEGMEQNYATVSDQLSVLEEQMRDYEGLTSDVTYRNMLKERLALLEKLS